MHGCCHICFPNSCCDGKQAQLVLSVDGVCKFDQDYVGEVVREFTVPTSLLDA